MVVEAPLNEARSLAVIAKVKETIPGKPIKYLVNTHAHFDHSGGLRTYVAEGATIVTHRGNEAYYKKVWAAPHTLNPCAVSLYDNIRQLKLEVDQIAALHGPRVVKLADLRAAIGLQDTATAAP